MFKCIDNVITDVIGGVCLTFSSKRWLNVSKYYCWIKDYISFYYSLIYASYACKFCIILASYLANALVYIATIVASLIIKLNKYFLLLKCYAFRCKALYACIASVFIPLLNLVLFIISLPFIGYYEVLAHFYYLQLKEW